MFARRHALRTVACLCLAALGSELRGAEPPDVRWASYRAQRSWIALNDWLGRWPTHQAWLQALRAERMLAVLAAPSDAAADEVRGLAERYARQSQLTSREFRDFRQAFNEFAALRNGDADRSASEEVNAALARPVANRSANALQARAAFRRALVDLENRLAYDSGRGGSWRAYLQIESLRQVVDRPADVDPATLDALELRLHSAEAAWPIREIAAASAAFATNAKHLRALLTPDYAAARQERLNSIASLLASYAQSASDETYRDLGAEALWLDQRLEEPQLAAALIKRFQQPQMLMVFSAPAIRAEFSETLAESFPINDVYVSTRVYGRGELTGNVNALPLQAEGAAGVQLTLNAQVQAFTSGSRSGVRVNSTGRTNITGRKRLLIAPEGLQTSPAEVNASSQVDFSSIAAPGGRYGSEARGQVYGSRGRAEAQAEAGARRLASERLNNFADAHARRLNSWLREKVILPLIWRDAYPRSVRGASGIHELAIELRGVGVERTSPLFAPPAQMPTAGAALQVHASYVEQTADILLRNRRFSGRQIADFFSDNDKPPAPAPPSDEDDGDEPTEWHLTFASDPLDLHCHESQLTATLRLADIESDGESQGSAQVSLDYSLALRNGVISLTRANPVVTRPLEATAEERMSGPQKVMQKTLSRRLSTIVPSVYLLRKLFPNGMFAALRPVTITGADDWLTVELAPLSIGARGKR